MEYKKYIKLIKETDIAEYSNIKGFIILKPYGYEIWDNIKNILNKILIKNNYKNVIFPLLISKKLIETENRYIKKKRELKCGIISYKKFKKKNDNLIIDKNSKLKDELIIRPTSESIIWATFKKWIKSYKDLPILINQWGNVIRFEMKNTMLLRNSEIFWQEGHTAHANKKDAENEIKKIKKIYKILIKKYLSIPYIFGYKTPNETFIGANKTYTFETITKNKKKSIQLATIHFLKKNFSKAFNVKYINKKCKNKYVWGTSWGLSIRLIGAIIMLHNDKNGIILPPKISPIQVIIIYILKKKNKKQKKIIKKLKKILNKEKTIRYKIDNDTLSTPGKKFYKYEKMGVPLRITIGEREIKKKIIEITRRDNFKKYILKLDYKLNKKILKLLNIIQKKIYKNAKKNIKKNTVYLDKNFKIFKEKMLKDNGFIITYWDKNLKTELKIKKETLATIRCIPNLKKKNGKCIYSRKKTNLRVVYGKSY
ncbi:MAG: His/Gly/Thr/Pro-type tRNA ligase C-terminal domain-containing protein [Candidatus Shikimatogenerans sp. JK-2022]|nr:His/Gly/Thr/Pro-type tRNA ligase C-terminal domain-containing protein [Candidatus Shikimatogenerans bostrichidophilus]